MPPSPSTPPWASWSRCPVASAATSTLSSGTPRPRSSTASTPAGARRTGRHARTSPRREWRRYPAAVFKNPNLARTYRAIAEEGRDAFYKGRVARDIVAFSEKNGGLFSAKDFADHTSTWVDPVGTTYRGFEVWEIPPPGQGIAAL